MGNIRTEIEEKLPYFKKQLLATLWGPKRQARYTIYWPRVHEIFPIAAEYSATQKYGMYVNQ